MPDWSYQTVFKPILFRLPPRAGRSIALGVMGRLGRSRLGRRVIEFMGHFQIEPELKCVHDNLIFPSPVGIGCRLDPELRAQRALSRFGVGMLEIGPVTAAASHAPVLTLIPKCEEVGYSSGAEIVSIDHAVELLRRPFEIPVFARIKADDPTVLQVIERLHERVDGFILEPSDSSEMTALVQLVRERKRKLLLHVTNENAGNVANWKDSHQPDGFVAEGSCNSSNNSLRFGKSAFPDTLKLARQIRSQVGPDLLVISTGGIHEPGEGVQLLEAGADLVLVDTGMVFSGPGLPKRINDAALSYLPQYRESPRARTSTPPPTRLSWFWTLLMGTGLFLGGVIAFLIAVTHVILPYDESQSGLTRADLMRINDKLLDFMQHDRVTVAGTMFGLGILYIALSWNGSRRGWHWAHLASVSSAFIGFFSFFLFLGFGYFDPFHAFVTAIMFQLLVMAMHSEMPPVTKRGLPELTNDAAWKRSQWGQLILVVHGAALIVAGATISCFGITSVFVPEDLDFMQTTYDEICTTDPLLVPLVAHDRATFGGMTLSTGVTILLCALWGFRRGNRWLWRALMLGGTLCYLTTLWVHLKVGYTNLTHLLPVYFGLSMLWLTGVLSHEHLCSEKFEE